jgi:hypothetical protein
VTESINSSIATGNTKKITLHMRTNIVLDDSYLIQQYGLTCIRSNIIRRPRLDYSRLVGGLAQQR